MVLGYLYKPSVSMLDGYDTRIDSGYCTTTSRVQVKLILLNKSIIPFRSFGFLTSQHKNKLEDDVNSDNFINLEVI